eukprot:scaffold1875_cov339-Prasinococcus_capsulatus_cf.AAC.1
MQCNHHKQRTARKCEDASFSIFLAPRPVGNAATRQQQTAAGTPRAPLRPRRRARRTARAPPRPREAASSCPRRWAPPRPTCIPTAACKEAWATASLAARPTAFAQRRRREERIRPTCHLHVREQQHRALRVATRDVARPGTGFLRHSGAAACADAADVCAAARGGGCKVSEARSRTAWPTRFRRSTRPRPVAPARVRRARARQHRTRKRKSGAAHVPTHLSS